MPGMAAKIRLTEKQLVVIEELAGSRSVSVAIGQRATIVLLGFRGMLNEGIAEVVGLNRQQVGRWRKRWQKGVGRVVRVGMLGAAPVAGGNSESVVRCSASKRKADVHRRPGGADRGRGL